MEKEIEKTEEKLLQVNTQFTNEFSKATYEQTYRYSITDKNVNDTHLRVATDLASGEKDKIYWTNKFLYAQENFKFVAGGRITSNAGTGLEGTTYINCFVDGFIGEDQDSMEGILATLARQALILKSEGGYGFCADVMRPRGAFIRGIGNSSPGSIRMLDMWDTQSAVITDGSGKKNEDKRAKEKIRKGAQMVTMSCWHPDIEEFITSKATPNRLTKFNMSCLITDGFMNAVKNNLSWNLEFPDYEFDTKVYKKEWDGNIVKWKAKGYPTKIYKTFTNANELWELIMQSTYNRNEPGVLFVDTMNKLNNLYYCEHITATNPCGEQVLPIGGVCLLGSINLSQVVDVKNKNWDYKSLEEIIPIVVRLMDNVNDRTKVPLESQKENLVNKRRIGLGYLGYGSALMMMGVRYGSEEALELTNKLGSFVMNKAYQASALLAKEKGPFKLYDAEKYLAGEFVKGLSSETIALIKKHGLRNSHLLSIQPTGNSSVFANNVSSGLEPIFLTEYIRTATQPYAPEGLKTPQGIDWTGKTFEEVKDQKWEWKKEGDENLLWTTFHGDTWKMDKNRGLLKESIVRDYAVNYLESKKLWNPKADYVVTTTELTIDDHVKTMEIFSKYIDSAMSKTINLPKDYPYEDFKKLYTKMYETGTIKGGTTYRAGTTATVLSEVEKPKSEGKSAFSENHAPKRPKELEADVIRFQNGNEKWIAFIGILNNRPYELFTGKAEDVLNLPLWVEKGKVIKTKGKNGQNRYDFYFEDKDEYGVTIEGISRTFDKNYWNYAKLISGILRHGMPLTHVVELINSLNLESDLINTWKTGAARAIKRYIANGTAAADTKCDECGDINGIHYEEGCLKCKNCGFSKCG